MEHYLQERDVLFSSKNEAEKEFEFTLPEYLPGISGIIKTSVKPEKSTPCIENGETFLDVCLKFSIIYTSDFNGKIKNAVFDECIKLPFKDSFSAYENAALTPSCSVSGTASKMISPRKIHTRLNLVFGLRAEKHSDKEFYKQDTDDGIFIFKKPVDYCTRAAGIEYDGSFSAEITLGEKDAPASEIIFADAQFLDAETVCTDGRINCNANFLLHVLYELSETAESGSSDTPSYAAAAFPYSVKFDFDDGKINDRFVCEMHFDTGTCSSSVSFDSYGDSKVITLEIPYVASGSAFSKESIHIPCDAFSDKYECNIKTSSVCCEKFLMPIGEKVTLSEKIKTDISNISDISECSAKIVSVSFENNGGKFFAAAKCRVEVFGTSVTGNLSSIEALHTLHIPIGHSAFTASSIYPDVIISVPSAVCRIREGELWGEFTVSVKGAFFEKVCFDVIESIEKSELNTSTHDGKIIIYYPEGSETVWDISKKYRTNPDLLKKINGIEGENIQSMKTLMIP